MDGQDSFRVLVGGSCLVFIYFINKVTWHLISSSPLMSVSSSEMKIYKSSGLAIWEKLATTYLFLFY